MGRAVAAGKFRLLIGEGLTTTVALAITGTPRVSAICTSVCGGSASVGRTGTAGVAAAATVAVGVYVFGPIICPLGEVVSLSASIRTF
jgi:hypothetical protein